MGEIWSFFFFLNFFVDQTNKKQYSVLYNINLDLTRKQNFHFASVVVLITNTGFDIVFPKFLEVFG